MTAIAQRAVRLYRDTDLTVAEIAEAIGRTTRQVHRYVAAAGIPQRLDLRDRTEEYLALARADVPIREIVRRVGGRREVLRQLIRENKIPHRPSHYADRPFGRLRRREIRVVDE